MSLQEFRARQEAELEELHRNLDSELELFRESCLADGRQHFISSLNSMQAFFHESNAQAKRFYRAQMNGAAAMRSRGVSTEVVESIEKLACNTLKGAIMSNRASLDEFIRDCAPAR